MPEFRNRISVKSSETLEILDINEEAFTVFNYKGNKHNDPGAPKKILKKLFFLQISLAMQALTALDKLSRSSRQLITQSVIDTHPRMPVGVSFMMGLSRVLCTSIVFLSAVETFRLGNRGSFNPHNSRKLTVLH